VTNATFPTSRAARTLERLEGKPATVREAMFWALAAASRRDWVYALKWLDLAEQEDTDAPRTLQRMRAEWSRALERDSAVTTEERVAV